MIRKIIQTVTPVSEGQRAAGYERFFGLKEPPFSLAPDPRFLFASASHSAALAEIAYAIDRREPIVVVTGEIGTGKTLLCRTVLTRLPRKTFVSVVSDPLLGPDELLKQLLLDFGVLSRDWTQTAQTSRHELVEATHAFLRSLASIQAHAVVIVDEAQHLQPAVLEQIRLLANIDDERGTLLQIILVGQSDVEPLLMRPELRQIQQRVTRRYRLERLTPDEVRQYIAHRLALAREGTTRSQTLGAAELARVLAEWNGDTPSVEFAPAAVAAVARISGGLPRVVNLLCDRALEILHTSQKRVVDEAAVQNAARALRLEDEGFWTSASVDLPAVHEGEPSDAVAAQSPAEHAAPAFADLPDGQIIDESQAPPAESEPSAPKATRSRRPLMLAVGGLVLVAAVWFGSRLMREPAAPPTSPAAPATSPKPQAPAKAPVAVPPPAAAASSTASVPPAPSTTPPKASSSPAPKPSAPEGTPSAGEFEIVVASFKTEARAASVRAELVKLGVPARARSIGAWQQVTCGPFATRAAAENAQQLLNRSGYDGTQIVVTGATPPKP